MNHASNIIQCPNASFHDLMISCPKCTYLNAYAGKPDVSTSREVRITDPVTGGSKGQKPEQYSLIPVEALAEVARVYGEGAKKYTTYGECNCSALSATDRARPEGSVGAITKSGSRVETRNTPNDSGQTVPLGTQQIDRESTNTSGNGEWENPLASTRSTISPEANTMLTYPLRVESAADLANILTTTMAAASGAVETASGAGFATDATSEWGTSKAGMPSTEKQHKPGCNSQKVISEGRNNWRLGYSWSLSYDALQRHINAFWRRESADPDDSLHHLAHAAFHLFSLMTFEWEGLGADDRA